MTNTPIEFSGGSQEVMTSGASLVTTTDSGPVTATVLQRQCVDPGIPAVPEPSAAVLLVVCLVMLSLIQVLRPRTTDEMPH